jgi:hypothetical protein
LQHTEKHYGIRDPRLDTEPIQPDFTLDLWEHFWQLDSGRQSGMSQNPLMWSEIESWGRQMRVRLSPWELTAIKAMDRTYLNVAAEKSQEK